MATPTSSDITVSNLSKKNENHIDSLLVGRKWGGSTGTGVNLEYSFPQSTDFFRDGYGSGQPKSDFKTLTTTQKNAAKEALQAWSEVANIQFTPVTEGEIVKESTKTKYIGDIRFARSKEPYKDGEGKVTDTAIGYYPEANSEGKAIPEAGDIWFSYLKDNRGNEYYDTDQKGTYGYATFLHEIGHAIGLKHSHEEIKEGEVVKFPKADLAIDTTAHTVMSYRSYVDQPLTGYQQDFFPTTPMLNDIAAAQYLYGVNITTRKDNDVYTWDNLSHTITLSDGTTRTQILKTIWDAGGIDTIDWSDQNTSAKINLGAGKWSQLGPAYWNGKESVKDTLALAYEVIVDGVAINLIENATGGKKGDEIIGNQVSNVLGGESGDDFLSGLSGDDTLDGQAGNLDRLFGGVGHDQLVDDDGVNGAHGGEGHDTIGVTFASSWVNANGQQRSDGKITGGYGDDIITVTMSHNNFFINLKGDNPVSPISNHFQDGDDVITLQGNYANSVVDLGGGKDTFKGGKGGDNVSGSGGDDTLIGGGGNDKLAGNGDDDILMGKAGKDTLIGGNGRDRFILFASEGADSITDFQNNQDQIGLSGIVFTDLTITQGTGANRNNTLINVNNGSSTELLAVLTGIRSNTITFADFINV